VAGTGQKPGLSVDDAPATDEKAQMIDVSRLKWPLKGSVENQLPTRLSPVEPENVLLIT
jgi:hypothetical protein